MKGPGYKQKLDVRRTWKCPACGKERKLQGDMTSFVCDCQPAGTFMSIVSEKIVAPRPYQALHEHNFSPNEFGIEDMPVLQPHPASLPPEKPNTRRNYSEPEASNAEPRPEPEAPPAANPTNKPAASSHQSPAAPIPEKPKSPNAEESDDWGEGIL